MRPRKTDRHLPACMYMKHGAYYYVKKGKWKSLGKDYQDALLAYARITSQAEQGGMPGLIEKVLEHMTPNWAPNTVTQYRQAADRLKEIFAEFEPHQVMPKHVAAIKMDMAKTPSMANRVISFLRVVFQHALEWQLVESNPCIGVRRHVESKRDRYMTDAEFQAILSHCSEYMRCIFEMCYLTGQRVGDVLAIRLADITEEGIAFKQQKTGARLIVGMTPDIQEVIDRTKALPRKVRGLTLFCTRGGGRQTSYSTVKDAFAEARKAAGIEDVRIHDLRAKSLTDAKKQGKDAQKLAGHTDARMTARYIRDRQIDIAQAPDMPKRSV
ncbi:tyrosine-type recombinase/integrase [Pseudomonas sp. Marseille-QA0892]